MTSEQIRQRFCQDITAFNKGEINATILYEKAVRLGEESIIDKACGWLVEHSYNSETSDGITLTSVFSDGTLTKAFRKAMIGEITPKYDTDYLQSKIDAFTEARKKDGKTADEVLNECRGGDLELTWQDAREIVTIADDIADFNTYRNRQIGEEAYYKDVLQKFKEDKK